MSADRPGPTTSRRVGRTARPNKPPFDPPDRDAEAREVAEHLRRNTLIQLAHGLFGQTGFRLVSAPTFLPAYLFLLSGSDFVVGLARSLQAAGTVASPMLGASLIGHRKRFLGVTLASSALMRLQILGIALAGFVLGGATTQSPDSRANAAVVAIIVFLTFMGFFQGVAQVTMNALRAKVIPINRRGIISGARHFLAGLTSAGVSFVAGAYIIEENLFGDGYASVFLLAFGITCIGLVALALTHEPTAVSLRPRASMTETFKAVGPILRGQPAFRRFFVARALASCGSMALPFYILYAGTLMELTGALLGLLTTVWLLSSSTANLVWGALADRYGYKVVIVATLACWVASHVQLLFVEDLTGVIVFYVLMGSAYGGFSQSGQNMVLEFGRPADIPIRLAASGSAVNLVGAVGPFVGGLMVASTGYVALFVTTAALQAVALVIILVAVPEPRYGAR
ncbi:MAG: MFS transporter [Gammaproteobacteria bacterium]|nr:MFS transporter [Gammaproteobacteria bacterium]